jgi:hypothetical protein
MTTPEKCEAKAIPTISLDARMLYDRLKKLEIGEVVSYADLDSIVGRSVQGAAYGQLTTARRKALREDAMCFAPVMGIGIKRLLDVEIVATGEWFTRKIKRTAGRALRTMATVADYQALGDAEKNRLNVSVTICGAIAHALKPGSVKRIEAKVSEQNRRLAIASALEAFGG